MSNRDDLSRTIKDIFSNEELDVNLSDDVRGKIYTTSNLEVYLFIPKELSYIQLHVDIHLLTDEDLCALPVYCMAENVHDESWPRRVFGIDSERRMIVYLQVFPVVPGMEFELEAATEDLARAAERHRAEIGALISSIASTTTDEASPVSGDVIFRA